MWLSMCLPPIVHIAIPDDEVRSRASYKNSFVILRAYVPVLYDVWIVLRPAAPHDPVRGSEVIVAFDVDGRAGSEAFWSCRTWTNG